MDDNNPYGDNKVYDNYDWKSVLKGIGVLVVIAVLVYLAGVAITGGSWTWGMDDTFTEGYNYLPRGARYRRKGQRWYGGGYGGYWGGFYRRPWMPWYWRTYYYPRAWRYIAYPSTAAYNVYGTPGLQTYYL